MCLTFMTNSFFAYQCSMYPLNFKRSRETEAESGSLSRKNSRGKLIKWYYFQIKWNK